MASEELNNQQRQLLARTKAVLQQERDRRSADETQEFTAALMERIAQGEEDPNPLQPVNKRKRSKAKWITLAAAVIFGFAVMAMMTEMFNSHRQTGRQYRLTAQKHPFSRQEGSISHPDLLAEKAATQWIQFTYEHFGETCLWLFPKDSGFTGNTQDRRHWDTRNQGGKILVSSEALEEAFGQQERLIFLRIGNHFEIWEEASLKRYLAKSAKDG